MSRPRFLANHDLREAIAVGVVRLEPAVEFHRLRDLGMESRPDDEVLDYAARENLLIVSHDVNTMTAHAKRRIASGMAMPGIFLVHQNSPVRQAIEDLILIWSSSEAEEWSAQIAFLPL